MAKKQKKGKKGPDGLYHIQKFICTRPDGTRYYERFKAATWNEAFIAADTFKKEYLAGLHPDADAKAPKERPLTLGDAMDKYIDTCRLLAETKNGDFSHSTIPAYKSIRENAFQELVNKPIAEITVDDVQTALDNRAKHVRILKNGQEKRVSPKTIKNEYYLLKPVLDKYAPSLNLKNIKLAKRKKKKMMVLNNSEAPVILKTAHDLHPEFFLYVLFTMLTGMRPSEVYALTWRDVSAEPMIAIVEGKKILYGEINISKAMVMNENRVYELKGTKTESGERVLQHDWSLFETLYSIRSRGADDSPIFDMNPRRQQYYWDKLRDQLALPKERRFYDLRHYHCSVMVASGAPEDYIANDMGHSTIQMAHDVYVEIIGEKKQSIFAGVATHTAELISEFNTQNKKSVNSLDATENATKPQKVLDIV